MSKRFDDVKRALISPPVLALPGIAKPLALYMHERLHVALGALTQILRLEKTRGLFFQTIGSSESKMAACLQALAARYY